MPLNLGEAAWQSLDRYCRLMIIFALSRAAPCGHFATLVRSIAAQSARPPSESFAFSGASRALMQKLSALSKEWLA
ncbi:MAG: hypothetical protein IJC66_10200 [Kiritimatiellae bacterium]|nr:hypothetical protein [Kiritimatiellia bacterium]